MLRREHVGVQLKGRQGRGRSWVWVDRRKQGRSGSRTRALLVCKQLL